MNSLYIQHIRKIFYLIVFAAGVWFVSFTIFPENQIVKIEIGDRSPANFSAPRYLTVVDEQATNDLKDAASASVPPVYTIDTSINIGVIDGITEMFLTVIKSRTEEKLVTTESDNPEETTTSVEVINLSKIDQINKVSSSVLFSTISTSSIEVLVEISSLDFKNSTNFLTQIEFESKRKANEFLSNGVNSENLNQIRQSIVSNPPPLNLSSELYALIPEARIRSLVA